MGGSKAGEGKHAATPSWEGASWQEEVPRDGAMQCHHHFNPQEPRPHNRNRPSALEIVRAQGLANQGEGRRVRGGALQDKGGGSVPTAQALTSRR
jgi:hypothetical protein